MALELAKGTVLINLDINSQDVFSFFILKNLNQKKKAGNYNLNSSFNTTKGFTMVSR